VVIGASVIAGDTTKLSADKVIADAIKTYGGIHILIVADEIAPRGRLFEGETDGEWAKDTEEFLKTTYQVWRWSLSKTKNRYVLTLP
jgi:hypothetical protein